jgi:pyruvate formate lyase activating enzyme
VLETLEHLGHETDVWLEITNLLIPGFNDSDEELHELSQWVVGHLSPHVPLHFTSFHPDWRMLDVPPTPASTLTRARRIARENGVRYAYTGNVHDEEGGSTYCHGCGSRLIGRDRYEITDWTLEPGGRCATCGLACAGVFRPQPGDWGARRRPVRLRGFA